MAKSRIQTRLCPNCANSIAVDAMTCPYCRADLVHSVEPEWPRYGIDFDAPEPERKRERLTARSKVILVLGLLVFVLGVYLVGSNVERYDLRPLLAEQKAILADQKAAMAEQQDMLKAKDERIQDLESQLAQVRQANQGTSGQIAALKAQLDERQKVLAAAQLKLANANREIERLSAKAASKPAVSKAGAPAQPAAPVRLSRASEPRTYETLRTTPVYEEPVSSARVIAQISKGTQITVVGSGGGWLEVRSRHGKPPGYVRADDAMFVSRAH
jgi:hypothetical protein